MSGAAIELIGIIAAILTTGSFLPQALMILRTKNTSGISVVMYSMFTLGVAIWLVYGFFIHSLSVIAANLVTLSLAGSILFVTYRNRRGTEKP